MTISVNSLTVERWAIFELTLTGPENGNPFLDIQLSARFRYKNRVLMADGFYDGDGLYRIRCMPDMPGQWSYETLSNCHVLDHISGEFTCEPAAPGNHGPVSVSQTFHFAYADGTPYFQVGTTCYAWSHQGNALEEQTLETLKSAPFNKLRMCVFPKDYSFNKNEPELYAYPRDAAGHFDFTRFDPAFFRHLEKRVQGLLELGIEADIILFHPYDRWGFASMTAESDDRYLQYVVARLAAYRNVWWSMANEWDLMTAKTLADWDRFFQIVQASDPFQHLRSVHNCNTFYDHGKPWVTHASIQISNFDLNLEQIRGWHKLYKKPIVIDECCYEGNIPQRWGNIPAQEMVRRFWEGTIHGAYIGHGETFLQPQDILWWAKGGQLYGQSVPRLAFYKHILGERHKTGLNPVDTLNKNGFLMAGQAEQDYLLYTGVHQPAYLEFVLPPDSRYQVEIIDTWNMTLESLPEPYIGSFTLMLPGKPYIAIRLQRV